MAPVFNKRDVTSNIQMADVISMKVVRAARNAPDADCVSTDSEGRRLYRFAVIYRHNDRRYSVDIWAHSFEDAARHVAAMRTSLLLDGQIISAES